MQSLNYVIEIECIADMQKKKFSILVFLRYILIYFCDFCILLSSPHNRSPVFLLSLLVSWRTEGIKHRKNEIFLDVVEKLNILVSSNGTVLHSEIIGAILMKSFLSGMPELKLGLNDKLMFEATGKFLLIYICNFHVLSNLLLNYICKLHWNRWSTATWLLRGRLNTLTNRMPSWSRPINCPY